MSTQKNHKLSSQDGALVIEIILTIIAVGAVAFAVYTVHQSRQEKQPVAKKADTTVAKPAIDQQAAAKFVSDFYDQYGRVTNFDPDNPPKTDPGEKLVEDNGTDKLKSTYNQPLGFNPIVCAQDVPESFKLAGSRVIGDKAEVTMTESFGNRDVQPVVTVVKVSGDLKIDEISCPDPNKD